MRCHFETTNKQHNNCLNLIRLLAAVQVMYGHYLVHLNVEMPGWITLFLSLFPGVPIFFTLSGYLIWNSVGRSKRFSEYASRRFLRIYPELWIGIAVEIIVLLCFYWKNVNLVDLSIFTLTQSTVLQFWTPDSLRGYGCGVPNGSLWTICVIIQFYIAVWFMHKWLTRKRVSVWILVVLILILVSFVYASLDGAFPAIIYKLGEQTIFPYLWMFLLGALIAEKKEVLLPHIRRYWFFFIAAAICVRWTHMDFSVVNYSVLSTILLFCGWLGFAYSFPQINICMDISYGIYIYHMTVANAAIELGLKNSPVWMLIAMGVSCIAAYLSTRAVGQCVRRKKGV